MVVDTSRIVTLGKGIPKVLVNDPGTVKVTPLAADRIQVAALRAGATQIRLWDRDGEVHTVDVSVHNDARALQTLLREMFPTCTLRVRRLNKSVVISGRVDTSETLKDVVEIVEARFPKVIRDMTVVGTPAVKLHVALLDHANDGLAVLHFAFEDHRWVTVVKKTHCLVDQRRHQVRDDLVADLPALLGLGVAYQE